MDEHARRGRIFVDKRIGRAADLGAAAEHPPERLHQRRLARPERPAENQERAGWRVVLEPPGELFGVLK